MINNFGLLDGLVGTLYQKTEVGEVRQLHDMYGKGLSEFLDLDVGQIENGSKEAFRDLNPRVVQLHQELMRIIEVSGNWDDTYWSDAFAIEEGTAKLTPAGAKKLEDITKFVINILRGSTLKIIGGEEEKEIKVDSEDDIDNLLDRSKLAAGSEGGDTKAEIAKFVDIIKDKKISFTLKKPTGQEGAARVLDLPVLSKDGTREIKAKAKALVEAILEGACISWKDSQLSSSQESYLSLGYEVFCDTLIIAGNFLAVDTLGIPGVVPVAVFKVAKSLARALLILSKDGSYGEKMKLFLSPVAFRELKESTQVTATSPLIADLKATINTDDDDYVVKILRTEYKEIIADAKKNYLASTPLMALSTLVGAGESIMWSWGYGDELIPQEISLIVDISTKIAQYALYFCSNDHQGMLVYAGVLVRGAPVAGILVSKILEEL